MPTSKKQMVKLNQVKKAKAEELSKQAAAGSQEAKKKLKKLEKKLKWAASIIFYSFPRLSRGLLLEISLHETTFSRY